MNTAADGTITGVVSMGRLFAAARARAKSPRFSRAIRANGAPAVIAEYKRASPSRGAINLALGPATPGGKPLLRMSVSAALTPAQIDGALAAIIQTAHALGQPPLGQLGAPLAAE